MQENPPPSARPAGTLMAFLAMAFVIVGLAGLFATYAAPLPLERALARAAALDEALAAAAGPDYAATLDRLRPRLGESAAPLAPGPALEARILTERDAARDRFRAEADATAVRLRWLVCLVTLTGAAFGIAMMGAGRGAR
jgi:hypothetical protein